MNLSEKIRIIRKARSYTQDDVANKIGISRQTVSDWENGKFEPTLDNIRAITEMLDISYDTLLNERVNLSDKTVINTALKNLDNDTKGKINKSFRYRIHAYTITKKDYLKVIMHFSFLALTFIAALSCIINTHRFDFMFIADCLLVIILLTLLATLPITIATIKKIRDGGCGYSFGTLSETHLVIIEWSDTKYDRTTYIPVCEIESMELDKNANDKHGKVIVNIKNRRKPLITNDIVEPQKMINMFNNLETFIESPHGK